MARVLFVCLGNICRSPTAEGVFTYLCNEQGADHEIDSAGTAGYHSGERADSRMRKHAAKRGYELTSRARQVADNDFVEFDYIVAMDRDNLANLKRMAPLDASAKLVMMTDFSQQYQGIDVPDPYYGGPQGFEIVIDIVEESCRGLLRELNL